nr:MAG TPA: hypothetical protein [Bacteriophage sp.]
MTQPYTIHTTYVSVRRLAREFIEYVWGEKLKIYDINFI